MKTDVLVPQGTFELADGDGSPYLLGSYSPAAGLYFFPRRRICPVTLEAVEDCRLSSRGTLYSWTYVYESDREGEAPVGYGVGQVDLPEGPRVQARLLGRFGDWQVGMAMLLDVFAVDETGRRATFCFRPAGSA